jgi:P-type Cu+ transporter
MSIEVRNENKIVKDIVVKELTCSDCAKHVFDALSGLPGVQNAQTIIAAQKVRVTFDPTKTTLTDLTTAIKKAGYTPEETAKREEQAEKSAGGGLAFANVLFFFVAAIALLGALAEQFGWLEGVLERVPSWVLALSALLGGWKVFANVVRATLKGKVISHTLMTVGVIASAATGLWTAALLIVFFMRFGDWLEDVTSERSRQALKELAGLQPQTARVVRNGKEMELPVEDVALQEIVFVKPGEKIPVDGTIIEGSAPIDEAPITGESFPKDKSVGDPVFAASIAQAGFIKIRTDKVGQDTTFAHIIKLVEEAESQQAPVQKFADKFTTYYLPSILLFALVTYFTTGRVSNAIAVLAVACACAITMATPVVVLASVGNAAKKGLLVKGGLALEQLAKIDTIVMDKTGTLTYGKPQLTDLVPVGEHQRDALLKLVASVESRSEHPLAVAIVAAAEKEGILVGEPEKFEVVPGQGVGGTVSGVNCIVGNRKLLGARNINVPDSAEQQAQSLEVGGKTVFFVAVDEKLAALVAVADQLRTEVIPALAELKRLGMRKFVMLTGDNSRVANAIANTLQVEFKAELMPEDKISAIRLLQQAGHKVMMIGDGVNDGPALAAADVGLAMGQTGSGVALEAADVALMRDDWSMVPTTIALGKRAARTIRQNLFFTGLYNLVGVAAAFAGLLPPSWAAAGQIIPDVMIMLNSARLSRD